MLAEIRKQNKKLIAPPFSFFLANMLSSFRFCPVLNIFLRGVLSPMRYRNAVPFVFVLCLVLIGLAGCWNNSNPVTPVANPQVAYNVEFPTGEGNGTNQVKLNKLATGLNTISMQIRISNVAPEFNTVASIKTADGKIREFKKASIPFDGLVLAANDIDFKGVQNFDSLTFSTPIPAGAKVEIINADFIPKANPALRAAVLDYTYRMDYDGSESVISPDIAIFMAYLLSNTKTSTNIISLANELWSGSPDSILSIPTLLHDDLNQDGNLDSSDAVLLIAWYQVGGNHQAMMVRAKEMFPAVQGPVVLRPMELINSQTFDVTFEPVSFLNNYQLQIRIRNVPADFDVTTFVTCYTASLPEREILWYKSPQVTITDGIVLICSVMEPYTVKPFDMLRFTKELPNGAIIEIYDNDSKQVIRSILVDRSHTLKAISLSPDFKEIPQNGSFMFNTINVEAHYFDGSSSVATNTVWSLKSGSGTVNSDNFVAASTNGITILNCSYTENGVTKEAELLVYVGISPNAPTFIRSWNLPDSAGMVLNASGNLIVTQYWGGGIAEYDTQGNKLAMHPYSYTRSHDVTISNSSLVYVSDILGGTVRTFDKNWTEINRVSGLSYPCGITFDSDGNYYLAEATGNRITKRNASGTILMSWGSSGNSGPGKFNWPRTITIDAQGYVYVADFYGCRIQKFAISGNTATYICEWGGKGTALGKFGYLEDIRIDSNGYLYAADRGNHRIVVFDINQTPTTNPNAPGENILNGSPGSSLYVTSWGSYGFGNGQFHSPICIIVDGKTVYVSDYMANSRSTASRIQVFQMP